MKRVLWKHLASFTAAVLLTVGSSGSLTDLSLSDSMAATDSILNFAEKLNAQNKGDSSRFALLRFATDEQVLYRDDVAVGTDYDGFCFVNGKVMVKESAVLTDSERLSGRQANGFVSFEEAAAKIGCEITEQNGDYLVVSPFQSASLIVRADGDISTNGAISAVDGYQDLHVLQYASAADAYVAYKNYLSDQSVISVEPNRIMYLAEDSEPQFITVSDHWGMDAIGADEYRRWLFSVKPDLPEIKVAVVDTGIYQEHSWFRNRIAEGGTGFTADEDGSFEDGHGHGTHCAGIICSSTLDNVKILPIKCLSNEGYGSTMEVYCAMMYAVEQQADVVSMSLGGIGLSPLLSDACAAFAANDIPCAVAAGNESIDAMYAHPAAVDSVFTISAIGYDSSGEYEDAASDDYYFAYFSNFGKDIDFCAPGVDIESAAIGGPDSTTYKSGTSMATPYAAACIADLMSYDETFTTEEIYDMLMQFAYDLGDEGFDEYFGWGMIRLYPLGEGNKFCAEPVSSLSSGKYDGVQTLTFSCKTDNAKIYYTLDGSDPSAENGILYDGTPVSIEASCVLQAIAFYDGVASAVTFRNYEITCKQPTISPDSGEYDSVAVSMFCNTPDAVIYYTLDGSTPSPENGILYADPIQITASTVVQAVAICGKTESAVSRSDYCVNGEDAADSIVIQDGVLVAYNGVLSELDLSGYEITAIGDSAFANNQLLSQLILPESVTKTGFGAFENCTSLYSFTATGVSELGSNAFSGCTQLYNVELGEVTEIPDYAFYQCDRLSNLHDSFSHVTVIGEYAFYECDWLGDSGISWTEIRSIGDYAFCKAWFYDEVSLDSLTDLGIYVFSNAYGLETISLPSSLTVLPEGTFYQCYNLTSLSAPGVTEIGVYAMAFYSYNELECGSLFSQINKIGDYGFYNFNFNFSGTVEFTNTTEIGAYAFENIESEALSFPALKHVGNHAFDSAYFEVMYLESIETIGANTFYGYSNMIIVVGDHLTEIDRNVSGRYWNLTFAGPADSPAHVFANANQLSYHETPCIYCSYSSDSLFVQQFEPETITAYPLGFGMTLKWYRAEDASGSNPVYLQSVNTLEISTAEIGEYYYYAAAYIDGNELTRSAGITVEIVQTDLIDSLTGTECFELIDWDSYESDAIAYRFTPDESGYYSFEIHGSSLTNLIVSAPDGKTYYNYVSCYMDAGETATILIKRLSSQRWNALYISNQYISSYVNGEVTLDRNVYEYTGNAIEPAATVTCERWEYNSETDSSEYVQKTLNEGTDYILRYENNIEPGTAIVNVFGIGDYSAYWQVTFVISKPIYEDLPESVYDFTDGKIPYFCFVPEETDEYLIYSECTDEQFDQLENGSGQLSYADTIITVYDSDWNEIGFNDDGGVQLFSSLTMTLETDQTYYLVLDLWSRSNDTARLCITRKTYIGTEGYVSANQYNYAYTGEAIEPEFEFYAGSTLLTNDTDYSARFINNVNPGTMYLVITGKGIYSGYYVYSRFNITYDFDGIDDPVTDIEPDVPFTLHDTGEIYALTVPHAGLYQLRPTDANDTSDYHGDCYEFYYDSMTGEEGWGICSVFTPSQPESNLGMDTYYLILTQDSAEEREFILETKEIFRSLYDAEITVQDAVYTGEPIIPEITVYYEGIKLTENTDYILSYQDDMIHCGVYRIYIEGIGAYYDYTYAAFSIIPDISAEMEALTEGTHTVEVTDGGYSAFYSWIPDASQYCIWKDQLEYMTITVFDSDMQKVEACEGIGLTYTELSAIPGNQYYVSAAFSDNNLTGSFAFTLTSDYVLLDHCEIESEDLFEYQNAPIVPDYKVMDGDAVLTEGIDFEVFYLGGNTDYGRAEMCFKGKGHYIGYLDFSFYLHPAKWDEIGQDEIIPLTLEQVYSSERGLPGTMTLFSFTADQAGTYYLTVPDTYSAAVTAFVYNESGAVYPLSQFSFDLQEGETIYILCVTDWLEAMFDVYDSYEICVSMSAPSMSFMTENGFFFSIENGEAYLIDIYATPLDTGFTIPDIISDSNSGILGTFAGISPALYDRLAFTNTIYCEEGGIVAAFCAANGYCFAYADPKTDLAGDVTGDGVVNQNDAWTLLRWMTEANGMQMTAQGYANGDMNGDGIADMRDVNLILSSAAS